MFSCCTGRESRHLNCLPTGCVAEQSNAVVAGECAKVVEEAKRLLPSGDLTTWQASWCTADTVAIYLRGRDRNVAEAGKILAHALRWREEHKDLLLGTRTPRWVGDLRVLTRSETGHPILYCSFVHQPYGVSSASDSIEHAIVVLESGVHSMRGGATSMDFVLDCQGFCLSKNLNPRPQITLAGLIQQPYRDRLRQIIIVDAPGAFTYIWRFVSSLLPENTKKKVTFMSPDEIVEHYTQCAGKHAAMTLKRVMILNRARGSGAAPMCLPSEVHVNNQNESDDLPRLLARASRAIRPSRDLSSLEVEPKDWNRCHSSCCISQDSNMNEQTQFISQNHTGISPHKISMVSRLWLWIISVRPSVCRRRDRKKHVSFMSCEDVVEYNIAATTLKPVRTRNRARRSGAERKCLLSELNVHSTEAACSHKPRFALA